MNDSVTTILDSHGRPISFNKTPSDEISKAWKVPSSEAVKRAPKSTFFDPMSMMYSLGFKDRRFSLTYDVLRQISRQLAVVSAIVSTRIAQVCAFCKPARMMRNSTGLGFEVRSKNHDRPMNASERRFAKELENFILHCGRPKPNKYYDNRDDFETFTKKYIRDLMELDQGCFEIVPDRRGEPYEFIAVDSATIRIAADDPDIGVNPDNRRSKYNPARFQAEILPAMGSDKLWPQLGARPSSRSLKERVSYVQVIRGQIENIYKAKEMGFSCMNPRSSLYSNGYGVSNIELLVRIITGHLYAEQHNLNVFSQGSMPKGILNIRGEHVPPEMLESFRRQWQANVVGVGNSFKTPVLNTDAIDYIPLQSTNSDMEFQRWLEYLIRTTCSVFGIDPMEVGYEFTSPRGQSSQYETEAEWKIQKSKDRGLRPLLRFYAHALNKNIIDRIDDHFYLDFIGLDELSQRERLELRQSEVSTYKTLNEIREMEDLEAVEDGDVILSPTYLQWKQMQMNMQQMQQAEEQQAQEQQMQMQQGGEQQAQEQQMPPQQVQQAGQPPEEMAGQPSPEVDLRDAQTIPERSLLQRSLNVSNPAMRSRTDEAVKAISYIEIDI